MASIDREPEKKVTHYIPSRARRLEDSVRRVVGSNGAYRFRACYIHLPRIVHNLSICLLITYPPVRRTSDRTLYAPVQQQRNRRCGIVSHRIVKGRVTLRSVATIPPRFLRHRVRRRRLPTEDNALNGALGEICTVAARQYRWPPPNSRTLAHAARAIPRRCGFSWRLIRRQWRSRCATTISDNTCAARARVWKNSV